MYLIKITRKKAWKKSRTIFTQGMHNTSIKLMYWISMVKVYIDVRGTPFDYQCGYVLLATYVKITTKWRDVIRWSHNVVDCATVNSLPV